LTPSSYDNLKILAKIPPLHDRATVAENFTRRRHLYSYYLGYWYKQAETGTSMAATLALTE